MVELSIVWMNMMSNNECAHQLENISDAIAVILNARARVKCCPDGVIVLSSGINSSKLLVSNVMGRHGILNYQSAFKSFNYHTHHFRMVKQMLRLTREVIRRSANLTVGATVDMQAMFRENPDIYRLMYEGFDLNSSDSSFGYPMMNQPLHLKAGRMMEKMASVMRPDVTAWLEQMLITIYKSFNEFSMQHEWSDDAFLKEWIAKMGDVLVSYFVDHEAYNDIVRHRRLTTQRFKSLLMELTVTRSTQFQSKLAELNRRISLIQATATMREECVEDSLNDPELETIIKNPPEQLLAHLRSLAVGKCLTTLEAAFDRERPYELRKTIYEGWRSAHAIQIIQSCCTIRDQINQTRQRFLFPCDFRVTPSVDSVDHHNSHEYTIELPPPPYTKIFRTYWIKLSAVHSDDRYFSALFLLIRAVMNMVEVEALKPLILNASMLHSVAQIALNDQNYITYMLQYQLEQIIVNYNMDSVMTTEEIKNLTCGEYTDELVHSAKSLTSMSMVTLRQMYDFLFATDGTIRDPKSTPTLTCFYLDLTNLLISKLVCPPTKSSLSFTYRCIYMTIPALIHHRENQQLLCLQLHPRITSGEWRDDHRTCFEMLYTVPFMRDKIHRDAWSGLQALNDSNDSNGESTSHSTPTSLAITFDEYRRLPIFVQECVEKFAVDNPTFVTRNSAPKRSLAQVELRPRIVIPYSLICE